METVTETSSMQSNTHHNCFINRMTMNMHVIETEREPREQQPKCGGNQPNTTSC